MLFHRRSLLCWKLKSTAINFNNYTATLRGKHLANNRHTDTCQNHFINLSFLCKYNTIMKSEDLTFYSIKTSYVRLFKVSETSWSVYKQLIHKMRPRKLACMASVSEVVSTGTLDTKAKIKEMQQLEADIQQFITTETPIQRLKRTFTFDVNTGKPSVQAARLEVIVKSTLFGFFGFGGFKGYYEGREEFMRANKVTMFASKGAAHKRRSNHIMRCVLRSGSSFALKGALFCSSVFGLYQCIEISMNKTTPWSLALAFGVGGSLAKIGLGPKGMFSGFIIGSVLGFMGGLPTYGMLKMIGETQEELNYLEVRANFIARRRFDRKEMRPVTEYHEEVDDIE